MFLNRTIEKRFLCLISSFIALYERLFNITVFEPPFSVTVGRSKIR